MSDVKVVARLKMDLLTALRNHNFDPVQKLMKLYDDAEVRYMEALRAEPLKDSDKMLLDHKIQREWQNLVDVSALLMKYVYPQRKAISLQDNQGNDVIATFADIVKKIHRDGVINTDAIDVTPKDPANE